MQISRARPLKTLILDESLSSYQNSNLSLLSIDDFVHILQNCRKRRAHSQILDVYEHLKGRSLETHPSIGNHLVVALVETGSLRYAQHIFDRLGFQSEESLNSVLIGYVNCGKSQCAISLYMKMQKQKSRHLCDHTYVTLIKACGQLRDLGGGIQLHEDVAKAGLLDSNNFICTSLIDMYTKCGSILKAEEVFNQLPQRNVFAWTTLIGGHVKHGNAEKALEYLQKMEVEGIPPNNVTYICILKACIILKRIDKGQEIHDEIEKRGFLGGDVVLNNTLMDMYAKCGMLLDCKVVFNRICSPNILSWSTLIAGYAEHGQGKEAIECFEQMECVGFSPDAVAYVCSLKACTSLDEISKGQEMHSDIERQGFVETNVFVGSSLINMYSKCRLLIKAQEVFDRLPNRNVVSWNSFIAGLGEHECHEQVIMYFEQMQYEGISPNSATYVYVLKSYSVTNSISKGQDIHHEVERHGLLHKDIAVGHSLMSMYAKCGMLSAAHEIFEKLPMQTVFSCNTLILGYIEHGHNEEALNCFENMQLKGFSIDASTIACALKACGNLKAVHKGIKIHDEIINKGFNQNVDITIGNSLIDFYSKCGFLSKAEEVFDGLQNPNVVSWTMLIAGCLENGFCLEALRCFANMKQMCVLPNAVTYVYALKACGELKDLKRGQEIHVEIEEKGLIEIDVTVGPILIGMYAKCNAFAKAQELFDILPVQDKTSWNYLMSGYSVNCHGENALKCFDQMLLEGAMPTPVQFLCTLKACSIANALDKGQEVHVEIERKGLIQRNPYIGSALIDMYFKCGSLAKALEVFERLSLRDVVCWTSIIASHVEHGHPREALKLFDQMQSEGVNGNNYTLACYVKACTSLEAVKKGQEMHVEIERQGLLQTDLVIGNVMVDMYVKCGLLAMARQVFDQLPMKDTISWTTLIDGYSEHGQCEEALRFFEEMDLRAVCANSVTYISSLKACSIIGALGKGRQIHAHIEREGLLESNIRVGNALLDMYSKCGLPVKVQEVFHKLPHRDVVSWTILMAAHAQESSGDIFCLFNMMINEGIKPSEVTFVVVLSACSSMGLYDKCQTYFEAMTKDYGILPMTEHYTCMIDIFTRIGHLEKAVEMIQEMPSGSDWYSWSTVLGACRNWGDVEAGKLAFQQR